jgi:GTP-binding protein
MHFLDECQLRAEAGNGGNGSVALRREKYVPFGGPAGGDGGRGGDVVFIGDAGKTTLSDLAHLRTLRGERGDHGGGNDCNGRQGRSFSLHVPLGTIIFDVDTQEQVGELLEHDQALVVARGGAGGRGNRHFATSTDRAPKRAEAGGAGQERNVRLELKVMADVGLLGYPNVGKSTLIRAVSRARPKVADYPFTTLVPHLGVVTLGDRRSGLGTSFVLADIPGLIPGASQGVGLGIRFLKHIERTRVLLHLVTLTEEEDRDPVADYLALRHELRTFSPELAERPELVALSMADLSHVKEGYDELRERFASELDRELLLLSAVSRVGVDSLLNRLHAALDGQPNSS